MTDQNYYLQDFVPPVLPQAIASSQEELKEEVLCFLAEEEIRNALLISIIHENGLNDVKWRGSFFTYRSPGSQLEGVALIGTKFFFYAKSEEALYFLTKAACSMPNPILALCRDDEYEKLTRFIAALGRDHKYLCTENLMVKDLASHREQIGGLMRLASVGELDELIEANDEIIRAERGSGYTEGDSNKLREIYSMLLEEKKVWIWRDKAGIVCKLDLSVSGPLATYIEGFFVGKHKRRHGVGLQCLNEAFSRIALSSRFATLFVNENNKPAINLYEKAGMAKHSSYSLLTIVKRQNEKE